MFLNFVCGNRYYYHDAKVVIFAISSLQKSDIFSANYINYTCLFIIMQVKFLTFLSLFVFFIIWIQLY